MKARLEALRLAVPIGLFRVYHDDGYVASIEEHAQELMALYHSTGMGVPPPATIPPGSSGRHEEHGGWLRAHHHIFYRDLGSDVANIGVRAHEETEFLNSIGRLRVLGDAIFDAHGIRINWDRIENKEVRAYAGSVYALLERGMSLDEFQNGVQDPEYESHFKSARNLIKVVL